MRIAANSANQFFIDFLKDLVSNPTKFGKIQLPQFIRKVSTIDELCDELYPQVLLHEAVTSHSTLIGRAIHVFKNETVNDINDMLLDRMPGIEHRFEAAKAVQYSSDANQAEYYAVEYLQSINLASLPPSCLRLRIGVP